MAGEAKTSAFMLGTATVMIGSLDKLFDLNPEEHSIGLVKNFRVTSEPSYTDLTQGVKNQVVYSVMTGNTVQASMEAYEYTGRNIAYSLGLEGSGIVKAAIETTTTALTAIAAVELDVDSEVGIVAGDYIMIGSGAGDQVFVRKVVTATAGSITFTQPLPVALPIGTNVSLANSIGIGSKEEQPFLAAKIVGILADGSQNVILCPKIRITNGFSLGFTTEGFDNLPYEFTFYDQVTTDPFFAEFAGEQAKLITKN